MRILAALSLPLIAFELWSILTAGSAALPIYVVAALFWVVAYAFSRTTRTTAAGLYAALAASVVPYAGIGTEIASTSGQEEAMWLVLAVLVAGLTLPTRALAGWGVANLVIVGGLTFSNPEIPQGAALKVTGFVALVTILSGIWSAMKTADDRKLELQTVQLRTVAASLRQEQAFTDKTIAAMGDVLLVTDEQRNIRSVNRALSELLRFDQEKLIGLPAALLFANPDELNELFSGMLRRNVTGGDIVDAMPVRLMTSTGTIIPMTLNGAAIRSESGRLQGAVCVARDMRPAVELAAMAAEEASQRQRSDELEATNRQLIQAQAQLVQAGKLAAVGQLAAAVAHEINNPLTTINLTANFLRDDLANDPASLIHVHNVLESGKQCQAIIRNLLEFGRETGLVQEPVDLLDVVKSSMALIGHNIQLSGARIDASTMEGRFIVLGDPSQLRQVVINLLLNAGRAVGVGGNITLGMEVVEGLVRLTIKDDGHGMSRKVRERIFEPFFTTREVGEGTGLGLSVAYGIVRGHGGTIEVRSVEGRGSTFTVILPWRPERTQPVVLVIDDDPVVLPALTTAVRRAMCDAYSAQNGADAMRILATHSVDVVICDMNLGREDGIEVLELVSERYPSTMAILLSGATMPELPECIFDFLPKPVTLKQLKFVIAKAMSARRGRAGRPQLPTHRHH